jgi:type IV secretory pathway VirJ component
VTKPRTATLTLLLVCLGIATGGCAAMLRPRTVRVVPPCEAKVDIEGLPLLEFEAARPTDTFAVMLTGDGGWRHIDDAVMKHLVAAGVPVVGFDSPAYLRTERTPDETACDVGRVIRHYLIEWKKSRVLLIGYSRGSEMLPFVVSRLPDELEQKVSVVAMLGPSENAEFVYHFFGFLHFGDDREYPVLPEVRKIRGEKIVCVQGSREKESLCPSLASFATVYVVPGAHHFAGDYAGIARTILQEAAKRR